MTWPCGLAVSTTSDSEWNFSSPISVLIVFRNSSGATASSMLRSESASERSDSNLDFVFVTSARVGAKSGFPAILPTALTMSSGVYSFQSPVVVRIVWRAAGIPTRN